MQNQTRRTFFGKMAGVVAALTGGSELMAQAASPAPVPVPDGSQPAPGTPGARRGGGNHVHNGIYYFSGTGSNDGYPREDHVLVTDPFEKHVTRTMDALKKSLERNGCTMDSVLHLEVFFSWPQVEIGPCQTERARFVQ